MGKPLDPATLSRRLTEHDHNKIQVEIDCSDGIFQAVERAIEIALENNPAIAETLDENDYITWRVVIDQELGNYDDQEDG
jgi:hypothetical protein